MAVRYVYVIIIIAQVLVYNVIYPHHQLVVLQVDNGTHHDHHHHLLHRRAGEGVFAHFSDACDNYRVFKY